VEDNPPSKIVIVTMGTYDENAEAVKKAFDRLGFFLVEGNRLVRGAPLKA
jgi:hypothetical protein